MPADREWISGEVWKTDVPRVCGEGAGQGVHGRIMLVMQDLICEIWYSADLLETCWQAGNTQLRGRHTA